MAHMIYDTCGLQRVCNHCYASALGGKQASSHGGYELINELGQWHLTAEKDHAQPCFQCGSPIYMVSPLGGDETGIERTLLQSDQYVGLITCSGHFGGKMLHYLVEEFEVCLQHGVVSFAIEINEVHSFSTSGAKVLLQMGREVSDYGGKLVMVCDNPNVAEAFQQTGFLGELSFASHLEDALFLCKMYHLCRLSSQEDEGPSS